MYFWKTLSENTLNQKRKGTAVCLPLLQKKFFLTSKYHETIHTLCAMTSKKSDVHPTNTYYFSTIKICQLTRKICLPVNHLILADFFGNKIDDKVHDF